MVGSGLWMLVTIIDWESRPIVVHDAQHLPWPQGINRGKYGY